MLNWNAGQYLKFANERTRPCMDLVNRIRLDNPQRIVDLGCGPGNSTEILFKRWPNAEITGLDSSESMIVAARQVYPNIIWQHDDIANWNADQPLDLVFANASLQWLPDHAKLLPRLQDSVKEGGALAVQMPLNINAIAHQLMRDVATSDAWRGYFPENVREWFVNTPEFYYDTLSHSAREIDLWTTKYLQIMPNAEAVVEWYKGTGLRPFLDLLSEDLQVRFLADYLKLIKQTFLPQQDGKVLFPFERLFIIAYKR